MIKPFLTRDNLTQQQAADKTGIPQSTISAYVRGMQISAEHAVKLNSTLGIPLHAMRGDLWPEPKRGAK